MKLATARSRLSKSWKTEDWTWTQLVDRLRAPVRTGETVQEYRNMTKDEQGRCKDVGGFVGGAIHGGQRKAGSVTERWLVTLDADYAEPGDWESFTLLNDDACCVYSTHSHLPTKPRLRWIFPLSRAVTPEEYIAVARKVAEDRLLLERLDPTSFQPERLMYWPSCSDDGEYVFHEQKGNPIDPDAVLAEYGAGDAWKDVSLWPISSRESKIVQREQKKQEDPLTKDNIIGAFCRVYDIHEAIEAFDLPYEKCDGVSGDRYTYTGGSTAAGAVVYGDGRWLYSNHATDPAGGQLCNAWDLVRIHKFGDLDADSRVTEPTRLPSFKKMSELAAKDQRVLSEQIGSQFGDLGIIAPVRSDNGTGSAHGAGITPLTEPNDGDETGNGVDTGVETGSGVGFDDKAWAAGLKINKKTGLPEPTLNNACLILEQSPWFKGRLAYCKMGDQIYVTGDMPWEDEIDKPDSAEEEDRIMGGDWEPSGSDGKEYHGPPHIDGRVWTEQDRTLLTRWFENLGYSAKQKNNGMLENALFIAANKRSFSPIRHYLEGLTWDGVERLDTMLIRWMGAEDCELNRVITRNWMMGAIDRVMRPGSQFDSVLVFKGEQGIGKTRMMRALVGKYYSNSLPAATVCKESSELLQGKWVMDLGELDSVKRSSVTAFKNFITNTTDSYRKPYAINTEDHPRQCVFFGTTNESSFLRDPTGERRYWIVPCAGQAGLTDDPETRGTLPGFDEEVQQLWAEALYRWREQIRKCRRGAEPLKGINAKLWITDARLNKELDARIGGYKLADPDRDDIETYLEKMLPDNWEQMDAKERMDFEDGVLPCPREQRNYQRREVTLKELRLHVLHETPGQAASSGRTNAVYRVVNVMDTIPGWSKVGRVWRSDEDGQRYTTLLWKRG